MDVRRIEAIKQNGENIGNRTRVKVVKNKIAPPFKEAEFDIMFGKGISMTGDVLDLAANADIVNKSGAWYQYNGEKIGQGRENAKLYLENNPQVLAELDAKVRAHFGLPVAGMAAAPAEEAPEKEAPAKKGRAAKAE
jgi:recombination protein RecA